MGKNKLDWNRVEKLEENTYEINSKGLTNEELINLAVVTEGRYNTNN